MEETLSKCQQNERRALSLDPVAVVRVVGDLRRYRAAVRELLGSRYRDGFCDGVATSDLETTVELIENQEG
jgi:hypothetical protein